MIQVTINTKGSKYEPMDFFKLFSDGIRKRLPKLSANRYRELLIKNIDSNRFNFKLSEGWLAYKRIKGWSEKPFIATGFYKENIVVYHYKNHLTVGFRRRAKHPRSGLDMSQIAHVLEYGRADLNIPARPLWRYTVNEFFIKFPIYLKEILP